MPRSTEAVPRPVNVQPPESALVRWHRLDANRIELRGLKSLNACLLASLLLRDDRKRDLYGLHMQLLQHLAFYQQDRTFFNTGPQTYLRWVLAASSVNLPADTEERVLTRFVHAHQRWLEALKASHEIGAEEEGKDESDDESDEEERKGAGMRVRGMQYLARVLTSRGRENAAEGRILAHPSAHPLFMSWDNRYREARALIAYLRRADHIADRYQAYRKTLEFHLTNYDNLRTSCHLSVREYLLRVLSHANAFQHLGALYQGYLDIEAGFVRLYGIWFGKDVDAVTAD
ncbi:hypothetical protein PUNSTDRAFT_134923 [Punctularia strigosozonata HHB-11173 SS5]|uniref:uncharacterized protein n=1 Tax=Punctularia strigosozonata (strain HHB-11173) TaxID=741275 RepID=UPI0004417074|nr:uncharacterized protein PUNSTDRAFT_134923 [Punctularia strigosozonata HHB-11173 SS5]EIN08544.1 hypothetical protein PUNSTDRAFT_134923 [Punctularia strigosozonata HHB-11173 SS5]